MGRQTESVSGEGGRAATARRLGLAALIMGLVLGLDQLSKWVILERVMRPPRIVEVTDFFNLVLTFNPGISFGFLDGAGAVKALALSLLALIIVIGLFYWLVRQPTPVLAAAVGLISGGALGNAVDRLHLPGVVDFLDFHLAGYHWWAFNLADSAITLGVGLLIYDSLFADGGPAKRDGELEGRKGSRR